MSDDDYMAVWANAPRAGDSSVEVIPAPLTYAQQNMAILPRPAYKGRELDRVVEALIYHLRGGRYDCVGLSECFRNSVNDNLKERLADIYPHVADGPFGSSQNLYYSSGLLLFSRHPLQAINTTVFRQASGADQMGTKGALHVRMTVANHPTAYDIFLSHTQNPTAGDGTQASIDLRQQLDHLSDFVQAYRSPLRPALLMGDLNTNALVSAAYDGMLTRLRRPGDLWPAVGDGSLGITFDRCSSFKEDRPNCERHQRGERIDYFLNFLGTRHFPIYENARLLLLESSPGRDISDHYGLTVRQKELVVVTPRDRPLGPIRVRLTGFRCIRETVEGGGDEVDFVLSCLTGNGTRAESHSPVTNNVHTGEVHAYSAPPTLQIGDPGAWLQVSVVGRERDPHRTQVLGGSAIRFEREELVGLLGRPAAIRVFPLLTDTLGEYGATMAIEVD